MDLRSSMPDQPKRPSPTPARRIALEREISLQVPRFDTFVTEHSANISTTGMFIVSENPLAPGTIFALEFSVADDWKMIRGKAQVVWVRHQREAPDRPPGMGVRFIELDAQSRRLIRWIVEKQQVEGGRTFELDQLRSVVDETLDEVLPEDAAATEAVTAAPQEPVARQRPPSPQRPFAGVARARDERKVLPRVLAGLVLLAVLGGGLAWLIARPGDGGGTSETSPAAEPAGAGGGSEQPAALGGAASPTASETPSQTESRGAGGETTEPVAAASRSIEADPGLDGVTETVAGWAAAWSAQEPDRYLTFYSRDFEPPPGLTRAQWVEQRRQRLTSPSFIAVSVAGIEAERVGRARARTVFTQTYRSDRVHDTVTKTLDLIWEDGAWKIERETSG